MYKFLSSITVVLLVVLVSCSQITLEEESVGVQEKQLSVQATNPINPLIAKVQELGLHHGIEKALISKLENAIEDLEEGNVAVAINKLRAFINQVEAQSGKKIDTLGLIEMAETIIKALPIEVSKTATPNEVSEPGGDITFEVTINNTSSVDEVTINTLVDDIHGDLNGQGTCTVPQIISPDNSYSCSFTVFVAGNAGDSETDTVTATGEDEKGNEAEDSGQATVTIANVTPEIEVIKTAGDAANGAVYEIESGTLVTFYVSVENKSVATDPVEITSLIDDIHGDLNGQGDCTVPQTIASGASYSCEFTANVTGALGYTETNIITASGTDDEGTSVSDFDDAKVTIVIASITLAIEAGPIYSQADAEQKCPVVASNVHGVWTGHWWTTVWDEMSVCQVTVRITQKALEAGPIYNQADAEQKCPVVANNANGHWTGHWWTTIWNEMSVCLIQFQIAVIEAGPIWSQADAEEKCPVVASNANGNWTGQWWTTIWNEMSVCEVTGYWID